MQYDIVIPTWNSAGTLRTTLESIRKYAQPNQIIVVDRDSKDGTQHIAKDFDCVLLRDTVSLGSARMLGISFSKSPWTAFIDSDIAIREGWHDDMLSYIDSKTGAVQGRTILTSSPIREMRLHDAKTKLFKSGMNHLKKGDRGFTNTTMIRKDLLHDLDISSFNAWEDYIITQCVLEKGYQWKYVPVFVDHLESSEDWLNKIEWGAVGRKKVLCHLNVSIKRQLVMTVVTLLWYLDQAVKYSIIIGDREIFPLFSKAFLLELRGLTKGMR